MVKKTASVSIVAANYNNGCYLTDFINSINDSSMLPKELIIIDDGSVDNSLSILENFSHLPFLKVIKFEKNRGFCEALNAGIESASGDYILRVDPDDIVLPERIETQVDFLDKNNDIDVLGSNVIYFHSQTEKEVIRSNFPVDHQSILAKFMEGDHGVQHPSTMIRSEVMKKYKYNQAHFKAEDYEIFARMIKDGHHFANISKPLIRMRIHSQSVANNIQFSTIAQTFRLRDEIFGTQTSSMAIRTYYWYILNYRKFLITKNSLLKVFFLVLAVINRPSKLIDRIL